VAGRWTWLDKDASVVADARASDGWLESR
jgi:hypothetical protein